MKERIGTKKSFNVTFLIFIHCINMSNRINFFFLSLKVTSFSCQIQKNEMLLGFFYIDVYVAREGKNIYHDLDDVTCAGEGRTGKGAST